MKIIYFLFLFLKKKIKKNKNSQKPLAKKIYFFIRIFQEIIFFYYGKKK